MKKLEVKITIAKDEREENRYSFKSEYGTSGEYSGGDKEYIDKHLSPDALNERIRSIYSYENCFEDKYDYPILLIDNCGIKSKYTIPEKEKWKYKETPQVFKTGEIFGVIKYDHSTDSEVLCFNFVRFKRHNKYYTEMINPNDDQGFCCGAEWLEEEDMIKQNGDVIQEIYLRRESATGEWLESTNMELNKIIEIKEVENNERGMCMITLSDGTQNLIFQSDAELISELKNLPIIRKPKTQRELFVDMETDTEVREEEDVDLEIEEEGEDEGVAPAPSSKPLTNSSLLTFFKQ